MCTQKYHFNVKIIMIGLTFFDVLNNSMKMTSGGNSKSQSSKKKQIASGGASDTQDANNHK